MGKGTADLRGDFRVMPGKAWVTLQGSFSSSDGGRLATERTTNARSLRPKQLSTSKSTANSCNTGTVTRTKAFRDAYFAKSQPSDFTATMTPRGQWDAPFMIAVFDGGMASTSNTRTPVNVLTPCSFQRMGLAMYNGVWGHPSEVALFVHLTAPHNRAPIPGRVHCMPPRSSFA